MMIDRYDADVASGRLGVGVGGAGGGAAGLPRSGDEFLVRAELERTARSRGLTSAEDAAEALRVAEGMAARGAAIDAAAKPARRGDAAGAARAAAQAVLAAGGEVFPDDAGGKWLRFEGGLYDLDNAGDRLFRALAAAGHDLTGTARTTLCEVLSNAIAVNAPAQTVHFRTMLNTNGGEPVVWIDLMQPGGEAVRIDAHGWEVRSRQGAPGLLAERRGARPMPIPDQAARKAANAAGGLLFLLARHFPLSSRLPLVPGLWGAQPPAGTGEYAVLLAFIASAFYRPGGVPHLAITGEQGSGKTSAARRLIDLTDPDVADILSALPKQTASAMQMVKERTTLTLDNISGVQDTIADLLAVLATGGATADRAHYTNAGRALGRAKVSLILTSVIDDLTKRPDLAQRILRWELTPIPPRARLTEREANAKWEADHPAMVAALCDALSGMLRELPNVGAGPWPRLADTAVAAEAMALGLGWPARACADTLIAAERYSAEVASGDDPVVLRIAALVEASPGEEWRGTMAQLWAAVRYLPSATADTLPPMPTHPGAQSPSWLGRELTRVKPTLMSLHGIEATQALGRRFGRLWTIKRVSAASATAA